MIGRLAGHVSDTDRNETAMCQRQSIDSIHISERWMRPSLHVTNVATTASPWTCSEPGGD